MDIGYIEHDDFLRDLDRLPQDRSAQDPASPGETLWEEHGWALSGQQVAAALGLVLLGCTLGTWLG